jgi:predicted dienelactone hydrolase
MFVGVRHFELSAEHAAERAPLVVMYPTCEQPAPVKLGPYCEQLALDAQIAPGKYPLVVVSHGSGGSHLAYRTLAAQLAREGCVVALPEHPGNNRNDNHLEGTLTNLQDRPRTVSRVMDFVENDPRLAAHLRQRSVAVIGHSMGGYTALAVAGGIPRFPPGSDRPVDVKADTRVRALVLMAPATPWFLADGALAKVTIPILMFTAEHDPYTPLWHAEIVARGIAAPAKLVHRHVANAGHFSFLSPFPEAMRRPEFLPSVDPDGFDRKAFQRELGDQIILFLREALLPETQS